MSDNRPNPDALLARVQAAEQQARGRLKIFFGMAAGVGKTYAMLEAAQGQRTGGVDVVIGWIETHGRAETEALVGGLECVPPRSTNYRGAALREFDLDAALARRPALLLLDELAHTNAPGSRHAKRWQDVEELLQAGIDVYSTVNVQHLESLNDVVAQITGVIVRETVPDQILERADEVELIDLPPDDLLQRLKQGKVYVPQQAATAARNFFRKGNLIALRELALRRTADRVDAQMQHYRRDHAIATTWPAAERILVCVSPHPLAAQLVRATRRMATALRAQWLVVYVETPAYLRRSATERDRVIGTLRLAEQLGAEVVTLSGQSVSAAVLAYARERNVSKIVVGKPLKPRWQEILFGSVVDALVRQSGEIDVYVISGQHDDTPGLPVHGLQPTSPRAAYVCALLAVALCTLVAWLMFPAFDQSNLIMVYLLGVILVATRYGRGPSMLASALSVAAFDFCFVPPYLTFAVSDSEYLVTFGVMLLVALVISSLTVQLRQQADAARQRERRTAVLYGMSRELARTRGLESLLTIAARHIGETFDSRVALLIPDAAGQLAVRAGDPALVTVEGHELDVAEWVYRHKEPAGLGTNTLAGAAALYLPLLASNAVLGVVAVQPTDARRVLEPQQFHLLETLADQTALAIERAQLAERAEQSRVRAETERLRAALSDPVPPSADPPRPVERPPVVSPVAGDMPRLPTYLELLIDDPTLVPIVEGYALRFVTMMNSSFVDAQQIYMFQHPGTGAMYTYRAAELGAAIGRAFAPTDFIPPHPAHYVQERRRSQPGA
ncbi:MAG: sensor histidine kinase KdpD [Chloroflexi bacterium]|nr:sensor histidine kinase KdpD [Chloroflexota bacterium]